MSATIIITILLGILKGAGIGVCATVILYVLGLGTELLGCACQILTCNCNGGDVIPVMWSGESFLHVLVFCTLCGAAIGLFYGIYKAKVTIDEANALQNAEYSDEARKQREIWVTEIKQKASEINNICERNKTFDKPVVTTIYQAAPQMKKILNDLTVVAELQGKVDSVVDGLVKKDGEQ